MREVYYSNDMTTFAEREGKGAKGKTIFWVCYSGQHSGYEEHEIKPYEVEEFVWKNIGFLIMRYELYKFPYYKELLDMACNRLGCTAEDLDVL